jgi:hypothetical protein
MCRSQMRRCRGHVRMDSRAGDLENCHGPGALKRLGYAAILKNAGVIQLVECQLPKLDVAGSSPVARSLSYC